MSADRHKLTPAMRAALISMRDHGDPKYHLRGRSAHGGFTRTRAALHRGGYLRHGIITGLGLAAIREAESASVKGKP